MKTKRLLVGLAVLQCSVSVPALAATQPETRLPTVLIDSQTPARFVDLRGAVDAALRTHPTVRQAASLIEQREAEERVVRADGKPVIEYSVQPGYNPQSERDAILQLNVSGRVPVYDFGRLRARRNAAESRTEQFRHLYDGREEGVAFELVNEFLEYALWRDAAEVTELHIEQLMVIRVRIEMRIAAGLADVSDLRRADVTIQRAYIQRDQILMQMQMAVDSIRSLSNLQAQPVGTLAEISTALLSSQTPLLESAEKIPTIAAARSEWEAARQDVAATRAGRFPSISVGVANNSYVMDDRTGSRNASSFDNRTQFGMFLTGRMSLGGGAKYQVEAAQAASNAAQSSYQTEILRLDMSLNTVRRKREEAQSRVESSSQVVGVLEQARDLYWQEYILSKRQLSEVFDIEREIHQARVDQLQARADELSAVAEQLGVQGQLVSTLQIPGRANGGQ